MENESMKMTLSIIHSAPVKYIVFTVCLIILLAFLKWFLSNVILTKKGSVNN